MSTPAAPRTTPAGVRPPAPAGVPRSMESDLSRWFEDYFLSTRPRT